MKKRISEYEAANSRIFNRIFTNSRTRIHEYATAPPRGLPALPDVHNAKHTQNRLFTKTLSHGSQATVHHSPGKAYAASPGE